MIHQEQVGLALKQGLGYNIFDGATPEVVYDDEYELPFSPDLFLHHLILGLSGHGKGVFGQSLVCWLNEKHHYKVIDFNDGQDFENGCYGWEQDNEGMLALLENTFFLNTLHAYQFEMLIPYGFLPEYPGFFTPFTLSYEDLTALDFMPFYEKETAKDLMGLMGEVQRASSAEGLLKAIREDWPEIHTVLNDLYTHGTLGDETILDYDALADYNMIHSFATSFIAPDCREERTPTFLSGWLMRLVHDSRRTRYKRFPAAFYVREVGMLNKVLVRNIATRGRHSNTHLIADTQRRTVQMDLTASMQFSSYAIFRIEGAGLEEMMKAFALPYETAASLARFGIGVGLLRFNGMEKPLLIAASPPVCGYKDPRKDYMDMCREKGIEFIQEER